MRRMAHAALLLVAVAAAAAGGADGQQRDPQQRDTTRADARAGANPRVTARDLVGADDPRCDELCQRERMMDSLYGEDRERLAVATAARKKTPTKRP